MPIYYTKNIRQQTAQKQQTENNTSPWNDELELLDGSNSMLDIQDYIK